MSFTDKIFGTYTKNNKSRILSYVEDANKYKKAYNDLTHSQKKIKVRLRPQNEIVTMTEEEYAFYLKTYNFKKQLREGKDIKEIMPEAVALAREATRRKTGMFQYDVQVEGALAMMDNTIAEMKTGEGKTLVQVLSAYLYSLQATCSNDMKKWTSVHVMTANEYLAQRDQEQNAPIYGLLGMSSSYVKERDTQVPLAEYREEKKKTYACDIVYGTAKTIAFDYLGDNHAAKKDNVLMTREPYHAIVDEADDILLDQATIPLVLSGKSEDTKLKDEADAKLYKDATDFVMGITRKNKKPMTCRIFDQYDKSAGIEFTEDCAVFLDTMEVHLTERVQNELYAGFNPKDPEAQIEMARFEDTVKQCLKAKYLFTKNKQYIVEKGQILLIDANTGRVMPQTKYRNGMQQALEEKESRNGEQIKRTKSSKVIGKCTYPDFLSIYKTGVSGMTGTSDIDEFRDIYGLDTYEVPSRKPNIRVDEEMEVYNTLDNKCKAILKEVQKTHKTGQPILIGTTNVTESDRICSYLQSAGIRFQRLDAVNRENENGVKEVAGLLGSVTVATNMAGRGIDIHLGPGVEERGGLYVIGTSQNKNERVDYQLRGRAARQGQKGKTKYFASFDDELVKVRYPKNNLETIKKLVTTKDGRVTNKRLIEMVKNCQSSEESRAKQSRIISEKYEAEVYTRQKTEIYRQRKEILNATPQELQKMIMNMAVSYSEEMSHEDYPEIKAKLGHLIPISVVFNDKKKPDKEKMSKLIGIQATNSLKTYNGDYFETIRSHWLNVIDEYWESHMIRLDEIKVQSQYYSYAKEDPLEIYKTRAWEEFNGLTSYIKNELLTYALRPIMKKGSYQIKEVPIESEITIKEEEESIKL